MAASSPAKAPPAANAASRGSFSPKLPGSDALCGVQTQRTMLGELNGTEAAEKLAAGVSGQNAAAEMPAIDDYVMSDAFGD